MTKLERIRKYEKANKMIAFSGKKKNGKKISRRGFIKEIVDDNRIIYYDVPKKSLRSMLLKNIHKTLNNHS
jgi:hypothetical protein